MSEIACKERLVKKGAQIQPNQNRGTAGSLGRKEGTAEGGGVTATGGGTRGVAGEVVGGRQSCRVEGSCLCSSSPFSAS